MAATQMRYDDGAARRELGYRSRPAREALLDAARFYLDEGYVRAPRADVVRRAVGTEPRSS
jgi:hypothetical protein